MLKLDAKELRVSSLDQFPGAEIVRNSIYIVLDSVMDTYNIGACFRLADAIAAKEVILTGISATPPNIKIKRASINVTEFTPWTYKENVVEAVKELKEQGVQIIAVEQDRRAINFRKATYQLPLAIVIGNETWGVQQSVLDLADEIVELEQYGYNKSLNVHQCLGVVSYEILRYIPK